MKRVLGAAVLLACLVPAEARAQKRPGVDMSTYRPSTDPNASLLLEPAVTPGPEVLTLGAYGDYAFHPVTLRDTAGNAALRPISDQLRITPIVNVGVGERFSFGGSLPVVLYQDGTKPLPQTVSDSTTTPSSALGDLAFNGKFSIIRNEQGGFGLAALSTLTLPTGDPNGFVGESAPTLSGRILAEYTLLVAMVQASVGYTGRFEHKTWPDPDAGGVRFGDVIPWTFALAMKPAILGIDPRNRQRLEVGLQGWVPATPVGPFGLGDRGSSALSPVQLALSDRIELGHYRDTFLTLGGELGLTEAVGVPVFRAIAAIGWTPRAHDMDNDGVKDDVDGCPQIPEDKDGFEDNDGCPDIDNDEDGILDRDDACPNVKGEEDPDPKKNGCPHPQKPAPPKDTDGDGIPDDADKCPQQPEDKDGYQDEDGCPDPDNDGDGINDRDDACPSEKGEPSTDPALNGCPNPDRDGDTFPNADDKCPDQAEVFNGVDDEDGCPDVGGKPLVVIDEKTRRLKVASPIKLAGTKELPEVDPKSIPTLRAVTLALNTHPTWSLAVGAKPVTSDAQLDALAKSFAVVKLIAGWSHRDGIAETVGWDAVKAQANGDVGLVILAAPAPSPPAPAAAEPAK